MKIRTGFVSNSSSSSFVIDRDNVTVNQLKLIYDHVEEAGYNAWRITEDKEYIKGYTYMDNFDMEEYLKRIGIDMKAIGWNREN